MNSRFLKHCKTLNQLVIICLSEFISTWIGLCFVSTALCSDELQTKKNPRHCYESHFLHSKKQNGSIRRIVRSCKFQQDFPLSKQLAIHTLSQKEKKKKKSTLKVISQNFGLLNPEVNLHAHLKKIWKADLIQVNTSQTGWMMTPATSETPLKC